MSDHDWRSPEPGEALEEGGFCRHCGRPASEAHLPCEDPPVPLFGGADQRCVTLLDAVLATVHERGRGMPFPSILGVLRLVETRLISEQLEALDDG